MTAASPARGEEQIVLYAYGLGLTTPFAATGRSAKEPLPTRGSFTISFDPRQSALASRPQSGDALKAAAFVGLTPSYTGLYQINVTVPDLPPGSLSCYPDSLVNGSRIDSNLTINVGGPASFDGVGICVKPPDTF